MPPSNTTVPADDDDAPPPENEGRRTQTSSHPARHNRSRTQSTTHQTNPGINQHHDDGPRQVVDPVLVEALAHQLGLVVPQMNASHQPSSHNGTGHERNYSQSRSPATRVEHRSLRRPFRNYQYESDHDGSNRGRDRSRSRSPMRHNSRHYEEGISDRILARHARYTALPSMTMNTMVLTMDSHSRSPGRYESRHYEDTLDRNLARRTYYRKGGHKDGHDGHSQKRRKVHSDDETVISSAKVPSHGRSDGHSTAGPSHRPHLQEGSPLPVRYHHDYESEDD